MQERGFFEHVLDAFEGFVGDDEGTVHARSHRRGLKVWFGTAAGAAAKEHYEAQLIRVDGDAALEIGFHAEYSDPTRNDEVLARLVDAEGAWRPAIGDEAVCGTFLGMEAWRRISEVWEPPDHDDPEAPIEIAARLADYVRALEPARAAAR